jgi:hypothetical protein
MAWSKPPAMREQSRRLLATLACVLILGAQLLALAHSHVRPGPQLAPQTETSTTQDLCGLCVLVFHAPLSFASAPTVAPPRLRPVQTTLAEVAIHASGSHSFFLTRAPPCVF